MENCEILSPGKLFDEQLDALKTACENAVAKASDQKYLPLWMHMLDTGGTAKYLIEKRVTKSQFRILEEGLSADEKKKLIPTVIAVACLHDLGKMTAIFQAMILEHLPGYHAFKLPVDTSVLQGSNPYRHHAASGMLIALKEGIPLGEASVIGSHHGKFQKNEPVQTLIDKLEDVPNSRFLYSGTEKGKCLYQKAWKEIVHSVLVICGFKSADELPGLTVQAQMVLSGLLVEADWIASNENYYPLINLDDSGMPQDYPGRWKEADKKLEFSNPWKSEKMDITPEDFKKIFHFAPLPMQKKVLQIMSETSDPGLLIIEAPMGNGKTEAALAAAEIMAARCGSGGIYFGQPTQATANGLYPRFQDWASDQSSDERHSIRLAHNLSSLNETYANLPVGSASLDFDSSAEMDQKGIDAGLFVDDWMQNSKTGLLSDFVIGTVDQGLMAALNHKHVMLRHLGLTSKVVIIDEVHAYDAYMNQYFDRLLKWLGYYKVPIILLSATLPSKRKLEMINSYMEGRLGKQKLDFSSSLKCGMTYPEITWSDGDSVFCTGIQEPLEQTEVTVIQEPVESEDQEIQKIGDILEKKLGEGGNAGVIVNTVAKAQELGIYLQEKFPDKRVIIFHSRFTAGDRARIEKEVLKLVGKNSTPEQRSDLIVVGTQVLEQSLDIDFDVMITELAPADLLLQRIGRLHRHKRPNRPDGLLIPEVYVMTSSEKTIADRSVVYDPWILVRTLRKLKNRISLPLDIPKMVSEVYDQADIEIPEDLTLKERREKHIREKKAKAETGLLKNLKFGYLKSKSLNDVGAPTMISDTDTAANSVRDTNPSITVLLVKETGKDRYEFIGSQLSDADSRKRLNPDQIRELMEARISIPVPDEKTEIQFKTELERMNLERFPVWHSQPQLKHDQFLALNENNEAKIGESLFKYSPEMGLERI